jgi:hypothetical protein
LAPFDFPHNIKINFNRHVEFIFGSSSLSTALGTTEILLMSVSG